MTPTLPSGHQSWHFHAGDNNGFAEPSCVDDGPPSKHFNQVICVSLGLREALGDSWVLVFRARSVSWYMKGEDIVVRLIKLRSIEATRLEAWVSAVDGVRFLDPGDDREQAR